MDLLVATNSVNLAGADAPPVGGVAQFATDGNPALNIPPTRWPAYWLNALLQELSNVLAAAGITKDRTVFTQLRDAIRAIVAANAAAYLPDTGATNALVITPATPIAAYVGGQTFKIVPGHTITSTTPTLAVSGLAAKTIVRPDGSAVAPGAITAAGLVEVSYQAALDKFVLLSISNSINSLASPGYIRIPGTDLILQWQTYSVSPTNTNNTPPNTKWGQATITWPMAFNLLLSAVASNQITTNGQFRIITIQPASTFCDVYATCWDDVLVGLPMTGFVFAVGR